MPPWNSAKAKASEIKQYNKILTTGVYTGPAKVATPRSDLAKSTSLSRLHQQALRSTTQDLPAEEGSPG